MNQFSLQNSDPANFVVEHIDEGHRYTFRRATNDDERRVLSIDAEVRPNGHAKHGAEHFKLPVREFAIREALRLGIIDEGE